MKTILKYFRNSLRQREHLLWAGTVNFLKNEPHRHDLCSLKVYGLVGGYKN